MSNAKFSPAKELALVTGIIAILIFSSFWGGGPNYMEWDNFEFLIPLIKWTHEQWLKGVIPIFTFNQHMGDPVLANGQAGVFYFPYTLSLLISKALGMGAAGFGATIIWLHAWLASVGWYLLLRSAKVRPWLALLTIIGISAGGFFQVNSSIWVDMVPAFTWLAWIFLALHLFFQRRHVRLSVCLIATSVAMMGWAGHPQMAVYFAVAVGLFFGSYAWQFRVPWTRLLAAVALMAVGLMLAAPSLFPIMQQFSYSPRTSGWPLQVFFERSTNLEYLVSLLNPTTSIRAEFLNFPGLGELLYQGTWVPLGFLAGVIFFRESRAASEIHRLFIALSITGSLLFCLALGKSGIIYEWTYHIPIWGSFRWPLKIYYSALPCLAAASGFGLEIFCRSKKPFGTRSILVILLMLLSVAFATTTTDWSSSPALKAVIVSAAIILMPLFLVSQKTWATVTCLVLALLSSAALIVYVQGHSTKPYSEDVGAVGLKELKMEAGSRILPLSHAPTDEPPKMQEYSLLQSAMMNDYESATGCVTALVPIWRMNWFPADVFGVPYQNIIAPLLSSYAIDSFNVGYFAVAKKDFATQDLLKSRPNITLHSELPSALIYRNAQVLPQAYWATNVRPLTNDFYTDFAPGHANQRTVYLEGLDKQVDLPPISHDPEFTKTNREIKVRLNNANAALLVLSFTWYPSWRAQIDGKEAPVLRVNGLISGVQIPAGSKELSLEFHDASLIKGGLVFGLGIFFLFISLVV